VPTKLASFLGVNEHKIKAMALNKMLCVSFFMGVKLVKIMNEEEQISNHCKFLPMANG
jgi:hypothetical protein